MPDSEVRAGAAAAVADAIGPERRRPPEDENVMPEIIGPPELAQYLDIPVRTVYRWRSTHEGPPGFRVGKYVRYRRVDVERWIASRLAAEVA